MKIDEFKDGIRQIQAALQGDFPETFVAFLWSRFSEVELATWKTTTELLCRLDKQARHVVAADFYRCLTAARDDEHRKSKGKPSSERLNEPVSFGRILEIWEESKNPMLEQLARENKERRKEAR